MLPYWFAGPRQRDHHPDAGDITGGAQPHAALMRLEPTDVSRRINGERLVLIGWLRALLLQIAHPLIAAGVAEHSTFRTSTAAKFARLRQTVDAMLAITFGAEPERRHALEAIRTIHRRVNGTLVAGCGGFPQRAPYSAEDPALLLWVHATLVESTILAFEQLVGPLETWERDQYCADSASVAVELGADARHVPRSWDALRGYLAGRYLSGEIVVGEQARSLAYALLTPSPGWAGKRIQQPVMSLLAAGLLPSHIRNEYGLRWSRRRERLFNGILGLVRVLRRLMPDQAARWQVSRPQNCFSARHGWSGTSR